MTTINNLSKKPKKKWWGFQYGDSIFVIFLMFGLIGYPMVVMRYNPPPEEFQAGILRGVVIAAQVDRPNIVLRQSDGTVLHLDFPADLQGVFRGSWPRLRGVTNETLSKLVGCPTEVRFDRLQGLIFSSNPRIWSVKCDAFSMSYELQVQRYKKSITIYEPIRIGLYLICLIIVFAYFYVDFKSRD